jgi:hypothetical protein
LADVQSVQDVREPVLRRQLDEPALVVADHHASHRKQRLDPSRAIFPKTSSNSSGGWISRTCSRTPSRFAACSTCRKTAGCLALAGPAYRALESGHLWEWTPAALMAWPGRGAGNRRRTAQVLWRWIMLVIRALPRAVLRRVQF